MHTIFEPGFFQSGPVHTALLVGAFTAVVSAVVGIFTVCRSQSFAGHALTDVATTGGSAAAYGGFAPLAGFLVGSATGAVAMEAIGLQRVRSRDLATGIVLGAATGLSALFLFLQSTSTATTGVTQQILFGSIFEFDSGLLPAVIICAVGALVAIALVQRPLLLSSLSPDLASAQGVRVRFVGVVFLIALAVSVALSSLVVGSILSTALLIGPAATALRLTKTVGRAFVVAGALGIAATWLGILFAYDSADWDPSSQGLPVSFFI
ncbi:MAG TPA: metal ABC transporter permease, partial [Acidimicrobiales bacterium]